jgi:glycosyltransferase involved in cell wall biosynthesis
MAEEENSQETFAGEGVRPVLLTDAATLRDRDSYLRHCLVGLADESCKGIVLCPSGVSLGQVEAAPAEIVTYPPLLPLGLWQPILSPLVEQIRRLEPTVLHCMTLGKLSLTRKLSELLKIPYITSVNSPDRQLWRLCCKGNYTFVVTPSETLARKMRAEMPGAAEKVRTVTIGAFVSEKSACFSSNNELATMVIVHPLDNTAAFEATFSAIKHLSIDGMDIVVALMGSGKAEGKVRHLITDLGLGHVINIVPEVRPLRQVFSAADIYVKPVRSMNFDFLLLDAMSEGMAVAACRGDDTELLREGQTAAFFAEGDELSIYSTLASLLKERDYARRLAAGGQELVRTEHRVSKMIADTIDVYRQASAIRQ